MEFKERKRILFLGLPWSFTKYIIKEDLITVDKGLFKTVEEDCYMYKVQDVTLEIGFFERIFQLGTIICHTGDVTDPTLTLSHIKNAKSIKEFILKTSEEQRRKRRTLNTVDIGANPDIEADGIED